MNGWNRLRLGSGLYDGHHIVFGVAVGAKVCLACIPLFIPRLSDYGLIQAVHSISTIPMSHHKYNEWLHKVEI